MFGKFIKELRLNQGLSLRKFCRMTGEDASNWSKIERETLAPPKDIGKLRKIASVLNVAEDSGDWEKLADYAAIDSGKIPDYIREMDDEEVLKALPVFFRTVNRVKPNADELKELIESLKKAGK